MQEPLTTQEFNDFHNWIAKNRAIAKPLSQGLLEQLTAEQLRDYDEDNDDDVFLTLKEGEAAFYDNHREDIIAWLENKYKIMSDYYSSIEEMVWDITDLNCEATTPLEIKEYMYNLSDTTAFNSEFYNIYRQMLVHLLSEEYHRFYKRFTEYGVPDSGKTLGELFPNNPDIIDMEVHDLKKAQCIIQEWVEGEDINAELAQYIGMMCLSLSDKVRAQESRSVLLSRDDDKGCV